MEDKIDPQSKQRQANASWHEEFGMRRRFPRFPFDEIHKQVSQSPELKISLSETRRGYTNITIRLSVASSVVPENLKREYSKYGVTLSRAFDDVLWKKLDGERNIVWADLTRLATKAYRAAWLQWFRLQFIGHSYPEAEFNYKKAQRKIELASKITRQGRQRSTQAEIISLRKGYDRLLPKCELLHRAAWSAIHGSKAKNNQELARKEVRLSIWKQVYGSVYRMPGDGYIFGGDAFKRISKRAKLHDPTTWKPHQLAISLLSLEREQAYQTIEKKIVPTKHQRKL